MADKKPRAAQDPDRKALEDAFFLLKFRGRSESELARRLGLKGHAKPAVQKTVSRLRELGLLNDEDLARQWAEARRRAGQGDLRVRRLLRQRGIPRALADKVLSEDSPEKPSRESEDQRAWEALSRRAKRVGPWEPRVLYRRLGGYLARRGFPPDVVRHALERFFSQKKATGEAVWEESGHE